MGVGRRICAVQCTWFPGDFATSMALQLPNCCPSFVMLRPCLRSFPRRSSLWLSHHESPRHHGKAFLRRTTTFFVTPAHLLLSSSGSLPRSSSFIIVSSSWRCRSHRGAALLARRQLLLDQHVVQYLCSSGYLFSARPTGYQYSCVFEKRQIL